MPSIDDFIRLGVYDLKPESGEMPSVSSGRIVLEFLPEKIRRFLTQIESSSHGGDYSRQDSAAIVSILSAGYSPADAYATFLASPRGKFACERKPGHIDDYLQRTIRSAVSFLSQSHNGKNGSNGARQRVNIDFSRPQKELESDGINDIPIIEYEVERPRWLWQNYIPAGKITVLAGDPGMGKSTIALDLVSRITQGTFLPTGGRTVTGTCLIASAEDAPEDTIAPRLIAAGANLARARVIRQVRIDDENHYLSFPRDLNRLRDTVIKRGARLLIIDPLNAFIEKGTDTYKDQDVRLILAPLESLAEETGVSVLIVAHLNKKEDSSTLYRVGGSIGFIGAARSVLAVSHTSKENIRVLYSLKSNLARTPPALAYETREKKVTRKDASQWLGEETIISSTVRWRGEVAFDPSKQTFVKESDSEDEAKEFLKQILLDAEVLTDNIFAEAKQAGISKSQVIRVKAEMGIRSIKRGGRWHWQLRKDEK